MNFFRNFLERKLHKELSIRIVVISYGLGFKMMIKPSIRIVVVFYGLGFKMMM